MYFYIMYVRRGIWERLRRTGAGGGGEELTSVHQEISVQGSFLRFRVKG